MKRLYLVDADAAVQRTREAIVGAQEEKAVVDKAIGEALARLAEAQAKLAAAVETLERLSIRQIALTGHLPESG